MFAVPAAPLTGSGVRVCASSRGQFPTCARDETFEGYVVRVPWHFVSERDGRAGGS